VLFISLLSGDAWRGASCGCDVGLDCIRRSIFEPQVTYDDSSDFMINHSLVKPSFDFMVIQSLIEHLSLGLKQEDGGLRYQWSGPHACKQS